VQILVGSSECTINKTLSTKTKLQCYTPKSENENEAVFDIKVTQDIREAVNKCGDS
jgi:hypothetical protein